MTSRPPALVRFARELRRRRVFTTAGLYIVGAWLVMQAADVFFPGWGIPDTGINVLLIATVVGFPLALVFGWFFNITAHGIRRTVPVGPEGAGEPRPLKGSDYLVLAALLLVAGAIISYATIQILALPRPDTTELEAEIDLAPVELLPNSIAVLPFENISTDPENEVFCDGVSEEILNRLGKNGELNVIARTSSFQFKGSSYGIRRIANLLGVEFVLQGSVRKQGDRIRVSAQLLDDIGTQLWSQNYDRVLQDVFVVQDEIADLVTHVVAPQIVAKQKRSYQPSLDAYEHFLVGRDLLHRRNSIAARPELAMAVELDPEYAEAQAEYAISLLLGFPDTEKLQKADAAINRALSLVPDLPRALAARGLYLANRIQSERDPAAEEDVLRGALEGDPNMVDAMNWLATALELQGKDEEADEWRDKAYALDPFNGAIAVNKARQVWEEGDPERAESMLRRLTELQQPLPLAFGTLCEFYIDSGRLTEAYRTGKRSLKAGWWTHYLLAASYAHLGKFRIAEELMSSDARDHPKQMWVRTGWIQAQPPYWAGDYRRAASLMRAARKANGISLDDLSPMLGFFYGINQSLAGDYTGAIDTFADALPTTVSEEILGGFWRADPYQALAWAYSQSDMPDMARQRLEIVEQWIAQNSASVKMLESRDFYEAARNAVLMGDGELALDRLEQAVAAGWRGYYINNHDPRWGLLRDEPRYQALMAEVKADVDRQRAEVEQIDAEEDFPGLLDKVREGKKSTAGEDTGGK